MGRKPARLGVVWVVVSFGVGCGEISASPAGGDAGRAGSASGGSAGLGGSAGRAGSASGGSAGRGGSAGTEGELDAGIGAGGTSDAGAGTGNTLPPDCPVPSPVGQPGQIIAIQSVNFETSEIVLRNVSDENQTVIGGRQGWQWCNYPHYWNVTDGDSVELAPGETVSFIAINNQSGPVSLLADGGEFAMYSTTGVFEESEFILAFVAWGDIVPVREPYAVSAGWWTFGDLVDVRPGHAGIVATGSTKRGEGYASVRAACLAAPPNP
jgi:hypothetical protein